MSIVEAEQRAHALDAALSFIAPAEMLAAVVKIQELLKPGAEVRTGLKEDLVYRRLVETYELLL